MVDQQLWRRWRRLDEPGLELMRVAADDDDIRITSDLVHAGEEPFGLRYSWVLDRHWRTRSLEMTVRSKGREQTCHVERTGHDTWAVDGRVRPDLNGCVELDLSATPFCNALSIHYLQGKTGELIVSYVQFPELSIVPSLQRYEAVGPQRWRYVDLGAAKGFTAVLDLDSEGLVHHYEGLFETIE